MELEKMREKRALETGPLNTLGKFSALLIKDSLRIARLAFVDVSAAEIITEDATNSEEWGPTTKTMAAISDASKTYDDYVRILQVLRGRLSLTETKKWRQTFKALTIIEYLLTHGPEQFITDFRDDKKRVEELTSFVLLDENLVERGSALQSKASQVNQLLGDEKFIKEQRRRAQTVSKGILGFGSQSHRSDIDTCGRPDLQKCNIRSGPYALKVHQVNGSRKNDASDNELSSPIPQRSTNWGSSLKSPADDSPPMSSASTEWNPFDESPTSSGNFNTSSSPIAGGWATSLRDTSHVRKLSVNFELRSTASSKPELDVQKPQLPPSSSQTKCRVPPPPPGGSKVGRSDQRSRSRCTPSYSVPDLILM